MSSDAGFGRSGRSGRSGDGRRDPDWQRIGERRRKIASVRDEMMEDRGAVERTIDAIGSFLARPLFFLAFLFLHLLWIVVNLGVVPGVEAWDPYPFVLLATIASVEAPFVALLILMRQSRDRLVDEVRDEVILQVGLHSEEEQTMMIRILLALAGRLDVDLQEEADLRDLDELRRGLDEQQLVEVLERHLEATDEPPPGR